MKKYLYLILFTYIIGTSFQGCVSNINDPNSIVTIDSTATGTASITVTQPIANDTISYKGQEIIYSVTKATAINFIELHINGKYFQTFKANSDGSKPVISINLDSTYKNKTISYQLKYFDVKGYAETPIYQIFVSTLRIPPYPPYGLVLTKLSSTSYNISWKDSSEGTVSYEIWRKADAGDFLLFATTGIGSNNTNDESLNPSKVYFYKIRGSNNYGYSDFSYSLNTLGSGNSNDVNAPSLISAYAANSKAVVVTWVDNSNNENYFSIERKTSFTNFSRVGVVTRNSTSYKDSLGLSAGTEYTYRIKVFSSKDSSWSNEMTVKTPLFNLLAPTITSLSNPTTYKVVIKWKDNDSNLANFLIERKEGSDGAFYEIAEVQSWINTYDDLTIEPNKTYTYRIRCYDSDGYSPYSNEVGISTTVLPLGVPTSVIFNFSSSLATVNISWALSDVNVTKVMIERRLSTQPVSAFMQIAEVDSWVKSYIDYGTTCQKTYVYRLRSTDGIYFSSYTPEYFVTNTNTCK